jgi:hypothetical protein
VEEAQEAPDVALGIFFVNTTSAVGLFDSGASHSFISAANVEKHNLPIALLKYQMIVSSPGGDIPTRQLCPKVNLKIRQGVDLLRIGTQGTTLHRLGRPKEGSATTQPTIQKILEDHGGLPKA